MPFAGVMPWFWGELLRREGYEVKWVTLIAKDHPQGKGPELTDSHEVLLLRLDKQEMILDPMANTCIPHGLQELLKHPELAKPKPSPDSRYKERCYFLYDTAAWYSRVYKYAVRSDVTGRVWTWRKNRWRSPQLVKELSTSS